MERNRPSRTSWASDEDLGILCRSLFLDTSSASRAMFGLRISTVHVSLSEQPKLRLLVATKLSERCFQPLWRGAWKVLTESPVLRTGAVGPCERFSDCR